MGSPEVEHYSYGWIYREIQGIQEAIRIIKEQVVTLNRFKKGLNANLLGEIITQWVTTLGEEYDLIRLLPCKVIIDSGSCINEVSPNVISRLGLKLIPHPNPYKVSWVDTSFIAIKERCVVPR